MVDTRVTDHVHGPAPPPCGGPARAALLESAAVLGVEVWWSGGEARHVFPSPALAPGAVDDAPWPRPVYECNGSRPRFRPVAAKGCFVYVTSGGMIDVVGAGSANYASVELRTVGTKKRQVRVPPK